MLPKKVQKNQPITADLFNTIIDSIRECQIQSGVGYSFSRTAGGTTLAIATKPRSSEQAEDMLPFHYFTGGTISAPWFGLRAGTINGTLPVNWTSTFGLPTSLPYIKYINLNCNTDGYQVVDAEIAIEDNPPVPPASNKNTAPATFSVNLYVVISGSPYRTIGNSSIFAMTQETIRTEKTTSGWGQMPFDIHYTWLFTS